MKDTLTNGTGNFNSEHTIAIVVGVLILAGVSFFVYKYIKKSKQKNNNLSKSNTTNKKEVETKIKNYLDNYKNDCKNYDLAHFYSRIFKIKELQTDYVNKEKRIIFDDFKFSLQEEEFADKVLKKITEKITGKQYTQQITQSSFWIFLLNYYKLKGKIEALEFINVEHGFEKEDTEQFDKFEKENAEDMEQLLSDFNDTATG